MEKTSSHADMDFGNKSLLSASILLENSNIDPDHITKLYSKINLMLNMFDLWEENLKNKEDNLKNLTFDASREFHHLEENDKPSLNSSFLLEKNHLKSILLQKREEAILLKEKELETTSKNLNQMQQKIIYDQLGIEKQKLYYDDQVRKVEEIHNSLEAWNKRLEAKEEELNLKENELNKAEIERSNSNISKLETANPNKDRDYLEFDMDFINKNIDDEIHRVLMAFKKENAFLKQKLEEKMDEIAILKGYNEEITRKISQKCKKFEEKYDLMNKRENEIKLREKSILQKEEVLNEKTKQINELLSKLNFNVKEYLKTHNLDINDSKLVTNKSISYSPEENSGILTSKKKSITKNSCKKSLGEITNINCQINTKNDINNSNSNLNISYSGGVNHSQHYKKKSIKYDKENEQYCQLSGTFSLLKCTYGLELKSINQGNISNHLN